MAIREVAQFLLGHRRRPSRSLLFVLLGGLTFLTLCLFTSHLPALQQLTSVRPFGGTAGEQESGMTSPQAAAPHRQGPSESQALFRLIEQERAKKLGSIQMEYGTNNPPPFKDDPPLLVRDLPEKHIPSYTSPSPIEGPGDGENKSHGRRLVVVGDVHGHLSELKTLLRNIDFDHKHGDHLVLAGDMVTKGPDSKGVVKLAMDLRASAVRGNQEDKVLAAAREIHRLSAGDEFVLEPGVDEDENGEDEGDGGDDDVKAETRKKDHARRVARSLTRAQLAWLRSLPIILRLGHLPDAVSAPWNASTLVVVHGGLVPGVKLEKQDPWAVMNMRSLVYPGRGRGKKGKGKGKHHPRSESNDEEASDNGDATKGTTGTSNLAHTPDAVAVPIDGRNGEPWSHAWNRYQNHLPPTAAHTLAIYGHDAKAGLQVNPEVDISQYYSFSSSSARSPSPNQSDSNDNNNNNKKEKTKPKKSKKQKEKGLRYAFGLDSGCGHGKQLTALVIEAAAGPPGSTGGVVAHRIEQVDCAAYPRSHSPSSPPGSGIDRGDGGDERQRVVVVD